MADNLYLRIITKEGTRTLPLGTEPITIGRNPGNLLRITDERSSRYHCVIENRNGAISVTDLASRNGTFVNNQTIKSTSLTAGDVVRIGNTLIEILDKHPGRQAPNQVRLPGNVPPTAINQAADHAQKLLHELDMPVTKDVPVSPLVGGDTPVESEAAPALAYEPMPSIDETAKPAVEEATVTVQTHAPPTGVPTKVASPQPTGGTMGFEFEAAKPTKGSDASATQSTGGAPGRRSVDVADDISQPVAFRRGMEFGGGRDQFNDNVTQSLGSVADQERRLRAILDELDNQSPLEKDIVFCNARGQRMKMPQTTEPGTHQGTEAVVILRLLLVLCARTGASDVHVEPKRDHAFLRVRIDGMMVETVRLAPEAAQKIVGVVKILADLDITQKPTVQDGHFSAEHDGRRVDYRVSFAPSMFGQSLVIRVLDMKNVPTHIKELGMPAWMYQSIYQTVQQDQGMLICCGPTGSGKTTTLYATIRDIDVSRRNVITIEDPPEFNIEGVTQMACNEQQGNTFATLLRSVLRQDPDVVLVGEIRDAETARIGLQAAMTGHLVLTTVHAKDGIGAVFRLLDLGVEPFLVASALNLMLSQRLVRCLCPHCRVSAKPKVDQISRLGRYAESLTKIYYPGGCPHCMHTGYIGRRGLYELLTASEELRDVILKQPSVQQLRRAAQNTVFSSLRDTGYQLVAEGHTSLDEIDRVLGFE